MHWFVAIASAAIAVVIILALFQLPLLPAKSREAESRFRERNAQLISKRFGVLGPADTVPWHKVLHSDEHPIVWAGQGVLLGLRQVVLIEDHQRNHWRVVVAHQLGRAPVLEATQLAANG